jgi:hypothetical protein
VLIATVVVLGQGVVWYSGQFWALYFLQQVTKVNALTAAYIVGAGLIIGTPTLIFLAKSLRGQQRGQFSSCRAISCSSCGGIGAEIDRN